MSWDAWTKNLEDSGAHHCCIHGQDGNTWSTKNMAVQPNEMKQLVEVIEKQKMEVFGTGIVLNNERWLPVRLENQVMVMRGKGDSKDKTLAACLTKTAIVVGCSKDASVPGGTIRSAVENMKASLEASGY